MRRLLVEGDATATTNDTSFGVALNNHSYQLNIGANNKVAIVTELKANRGLRRQLLAHHAQRSRLREAALRKLVFGPGSTAGSGRVHTPHRRTVIVSPEEILQFTRHCRGFNGAK